ncbi:MAG: ATP-dependent sacrificial sulfur transferase LarE [Thermoplasmata archaeon]|nr:ATP-dependent sacrificial sulfur transferase LarE [Thermoplasmata archaeon]
MSSAELGPQRTGILPADGLRARLATGGRTAVALSGGVDSSVVAYLAFQALGHDATAVTLTGPAVPVRETEEARATASAIGIPLVTLVVDPLADASYTANPTNRCYFCRKGEAAAIQSWGAPREVASYLDGIHLDDLGDVRPGLRAMEEAGFRHPLAEGGWRKTDVRRYAREVGLPNWDRPSDACLASRVTHGNLISAPLLGQVQSAEECLLRRGFRRVRVRTDGRSARVEVGPGEVAHLLAEPIASAVRAELSALGFAFVELDPAGYRPRSGA